MNSIEAQTTVASFIVRSLPDSLSDRLSLLHALERIIDRRHRMFPDIQILLSHLEAHERKQMELPIWGGDFGKPSDGKPGNDGQSGDGDGKGTK